MLYFPEDCKGPPQPNNGQVKLIYPGVTTYGATASVSCNIGFEHSGNEIIWCRADGAWTIPATCNFKGIVLEY